MRQVLWVLPLIGCGLTVAGTGGGSTATPPDDAGSDVVSAPLPVEDGSVTPTEAGVDADAASPCGEAPAFALGFNGTKLENVGSIAPGAIGVASVHQEYPKVLLHPPTGPYAPPVSANTGAIDFGAQQMGEGTRALDFDAALGPVTVGAAAFTITAWVNLRSEPSGSGGNRLFSTHQQTNSEAGLDVVQTGKSLRVGINSYADEGNPSAPQSSAKLTFENAVAVANWTFFAIVYDGQTITFYFGNASKLAELDITRAFPRGVVLAPQMTRLTIGNFAFDTARTTGGAQSRVPRGMLDEIRFFRRALSVEAIRCEQVRAL